MNHRKKINQKLKARAKNPPKKSKPKYVSKADRAKLAEEGNQDTVIVPGD